MGQERMILRIAPNPYCKVTSQRSPYLAKEAAPTQGTVIDWNCDALYLCDFPQIRGPLLRVLRIRIAIHWSLLRGPLLMECSL